MFPDRAKSQSVRTCILNAPRTCAVNTHLKISWPATTRWVMKTLNANKPFARHRGRRMLTYFIVVWRFQCVPFFYLTVTVRSSVISCDTYKIIHAITEVPRVTHLFFKTWRKPVSTIHWQLIECIDWAVELSHARPVGEKTISFIWHECDKDGHLNVAGSWEIELMATVTLQYTKSIRILPQSQMLQAEAESRV